MKKKVRLSDLLYVFILLVLIAVIIYSGVQIYSELKQYSANKQLNEKLVSSAVIIPTAPPKPSEEAVPSSTAPEEPKVTPSVAINFEYLKQENPDVVAWIIRDDGRISLPIVQARDNDYYLHRDINGGFNKCGTVFMDHIADPEFKDDITWIFGHNMKDGSMFAPLKEYRAIADIAALSKIEIYTPNMPYIFEIKYVYLHSGYEELRSSFESDIDWENYISLIESRSLYKNPEKPQRSDRLAGLVTCEYDFDNARLIVLGVMHPMS